MRKTFLLYKSFFRLRLLLLVELMRRPALGGRGESFRRYPTRPSFLRCATLLSTTPRLWRVGFGVPQPLLRQTRGVLLGASLRKRTRVRGEGWRRCNECVILFLDVTLRRSLVPQSPRPPCPCLSYGGKKTLGVGEPARERPIARIQPPAVRVESRGLGPQGSS